LFNLTCVAVTPLEKVPVPPTVTPPAKVA